VAYIITNGNALLTINLPLTT